MINIEKNDKLHCQNEVTFDELMASLFVLVTHYSLDKCDSVLNQIVERLDILYKHTELELFPNQLIVLSKMRQLWRTKLFNHQISELHH